MSEAHIRAPGRLRDNRSALPLGPCHRTHARVVCSTLPPFYFFTHGWGGQRNWAELRRLCARGEVWVVRAQPEGLGPGPLARRVGGAAAAIHFHCAIHPTMRGTIRVTP